MTVYTDPTSFQQSTPSETLFSQFAEVFISAPALITTLFSQFATSMQGVSLALRPGRLRPHFISGTLSAAVTISGPTLQSAVFAALPVIASPNYCVMTINPNGVPTNPATAPEIIKVTAHLANSTSVTIERAQEFTAARAHAINSPVVCAPTALDALE